MAFARNIFQTLVAQLLTSALAVVSGVLLTRLLRPTGKGVYALLQADVNLLVLVFGASLPTAIVFYTANRKIELGKLLTIALGGQLAGTFLVTACVLSVQWTAMAPVFFPPTLAGSWYPLYVLAGFVIVSFNATFSAIFQGRSAFHLVNAMSLSVAVTNAAVYGTCLYLDRRPGGGLKDPTQVVLVASLVLYTLAALSWAALYFKNVGVPPARNVARQDLEPIGRYLAVTHVANLLQFLNYQLDIWLVAYFWNATELGYYSTAVGTAQLLWLIAQPVAAVLLPHVTSGPEEEGRIAFSMVSRLCFSLTLVLAVAAFILAGVLVPLVYGTEFAPTVASLRILLPGVLLASVTKILAAFIAARGLVRYNLMASAAGLAVTVILDLLLIPKLGGPGAAAATTVSYACTWLVCAWTLTHVLKTPLRGSFIVNREDIARLRSRLRAAGLLPG